MIPTTARRPAGAFRAFLAAAAFGAAAAAPLPAAAQSAPVPEGSLALPDMDSEVRGIVSPDVDAPLPPLPPLGLPSLDLPLPAGAGLAIPESAYRTEAAAVEAPADPGTVFTEASVGAAMWDGVSASLSVERPGADTSFGMAFSHDSADGFAFRGAGEGFNERRTSVSGRVRGSLGIGSGWSLSASFSDEAHGLQRRSRDFYGVSHRFLDVEAGVRAPLGPFRARAAMGASSAARALELAEADPGGILGAQELALAPRLGLDWTADRLTASLDGFFDFVGLLGVPEGLGPSDRSSHRGGAVASLGFDVSEALALGGSVSFSTSKAFPVLVPFSLSVDAGLPPYAAVSAKGGLATELSLLGDLWRENPYLDVGADRAEDARWFAAAKADLFLPLGFASRFGAEWRRSLDGGGRVLPAAPAADSARGLYGYSSTAYHAFATEAGLSWRLAGPGGSGSASLGASWRADWLDPRPLSRAHRLSADAEYLAADDAFGVLATLSADLDATGTDLPVAGLSCFVRLARGIRLAAEASDILAAANGRDGRAAFAPYLARGFQASAKILLSL